MTEEEKKEFEEFLEWKRAKQAAQEAQKEEQSQTSNDYSKEEKPTSASPSTSPSETTVGKDKTAIIIVCAVISILLIFLLLGTCTGNSSTAAYSDIDSTAVEVDTVMADTTVVDNSQPASSWYYSEETDEMTDKKAYFATITSTNSEEFDFPYQGGARLMLTVRKSPKFGNDIYIRISKGQFHSSIRGTNIKVRFDDEPQYNVYCNEASDGSSDILFLSGFNNLVSKLKTHKTMKINAEFFQEGNRTFTFDISNFEWDH